MTFDLLERSRWSGQPIGLLRLSRGALLKLYTNGDRAVTIGADTYLPLPITRSGIRDSVERQKNVLSITLPIGTDVTAWWRPHPPSTRVGVTWLGVHKGDAGVAVEWTGRVVAPKFTDTQLILNCEQGKTSARSRGLGLRWTRGCPLPLYSQGVGLCNVDKALHAVPATLTDALGTTITAAAFGAAPLSLKGGFVTWARADGEPEFRTIMAHTGTSVVLMYGAEDLAAGLVLTAYPGCPHDPAGCASFANEDNYGGEIWMPGKTPFNGLPL